MTRYPLTLVWPPGTSAGLPHGQWRRLEDGAIEITYQTPDELALSLATANVNGWSGIGDVEQWRVKLIARWHRELAVAGDREQMALLRAA